MSPDILKFPAANFAYSVLAGARQLIQTDLEHCNSFVEM